MGGSAALVASGVCVAGLDSTFFGASVLGFCVTEGLVFGVALTGSGCTEVFLGVGFAGAASTGATSGTVSVFGGNPLVAGLSLG